MNTNQASFPSPAGEDSSNGGDAFWAWFRLWFGFGLTVILIAAVFFWLERDRAFRHASGRLAEAIEQGD